MKKFLFWLIVVIAVIIVSIYFWLGMIVKTGVEKYVPPVVGVPVTLGSVDISIFSGKFEIKDLVIANPAAFGKESAFSVGKVKVQVKMSSLLHNTIIIDEIKIEKPMASVIINQSGMNLDVINKNIQKYLNSNAKPVTTASKDKSAKSKKNMVIKKLKIDDGSLYVGAFGQGQMVPLPQIEMENIGEKSKQSVGQTVAEIISIFTSEAMQQYAKAGVQMGKQLIEDTTQNIQNTKDKFQEQADGFKKQADDLKSLF